MGVINKINSIAFFSVTSTEDAPNLELASRLRIMLSNTVDTF